MLKVHYHETGATITGDEEVLAKATKGTGAIEPSLLDISDVSVNAQSLETLFLRAESTGPIVDENGKLVGYHRAKQYAALREKFVKMMELRNVPDAYERPTVDNTPAISTQSIKPVDAMIQTKKVK